MSNEEPAENPQPPTSQPPDEIQIILPEGYVVVKEADLRALEAKLPKRVKKTTRARRDARKRSERSRKINWGRV